MPRVSPRLKTLEGRFWFWFCHPINQYFNFQLLFSGDAKGKVRTDIIAAVVDLLIAVVFQ